MDFRQLKYFIMVAEAKSFTRAADLLRLAQPALSSQILKLEAELGEQLLTRHSRGVELTHAGRRLLSHARIILHQVDVAREQVRLRDEPEGLIRVGMPRSMSEILAVDLVLEARRRAPNMSIRLVENFSANLYNLLLDRELDIALTYSTESSSRVAAELISRQRLSLISPVGADLPDGSINFSDVLKLPLILRSPIHVLRKLLTATASELNIEVNAVHEIDSLQTALNMVEAGLGHTILPPTIVARDVRNGVIQARTIMQPELIRKLHVIRLAHATPTQAQLLVRQLLVELLDSRIAAVPVQCSEMIPISAGI